MTTRTSALELLSRYELSSGPLVSPDALEAAKSVLESNSAAVSAFSALTRDHAGAASLVEDAMQAAALKSTIMEQVGQAIHAIDHAEQLNPAMSAIASASTGSHLAETMRSMPMHKSALQRLADATAIWEKSTAGSGLRSSLTADWVRHYLDGKSQMRTLGAVIDESTASLGGQVLANVAGALNGSVTGVQLASGIATLENIMRTHAHLLNHPRLTAGLSAYAQVQNVLAHTEVDLLQGISLGSSQQLHKYLKTLTLEPTAHGANAAGLAAFGTTGLMYGEATLARDVEDDELEEVSTASGVVVVEWRQGQAQVQTELYAELGQLDPLIPDRLKGAWDDAVRDGPAAVSKAANCVVEALDWTMRALCRGVDLSAWLVEQSLTSGEYFDDERKPTFVARVTYAIRRLSQDGLRELSYAEEQSIVADLATVRRIVQRHKHSNVIVAVRASGIRSQIMTAEAAIARIFRL